MKLIKYFALLLIFCSCANTVDLEYYYEDKADYRNEDINENRNESIVSEKTHFLEDKVSDIKSSNDTSNGYFNNSDEAVPNTNNTNVTHDGRKSILSQMLRNSLNKKQSNKTVSVMKSKLFKDYEYAYDDVDDQLNFLRDVNNTSPSNPDKKNRNLIFKEHRSSEFYNIEPAADSDFLQRNWSNINRSDIWYVPEKYPCWELPLLYGQLGSKNNKEDVFLLYSGRLKNVVDPGFQKLKSRLYMAEYQNFNTWCGVQPCYGDHTLCLFPDSTLSTICETGYTVKVPSIMSQMGIINTLNSMRNRVASGESERYSHLPPAANMKQINYDYDLQKISEAWLRQCLPGPAPCSALEGKFVAQLECTKYANYCCFNTRKSAIQCIPKSACFINAVIGCIHLWYWSAGRHLQKADVQCGRAAVRNFNTVQLLWATTTKVGCAYARRRNGDIRVVCNFAPGAPFVIDTRLYCGIITHEPTKEFGDDPQKINDMMPSLGVSWNHIQQKNREHPTSSKVDPLYSTTEGLKSIWGVQSLNKIYLEDWVRELMGKRKNGSKCVIARLVTKYTFIDVSEAKCDMNQSVYIAGPPGSECAERGRRYGNLCHDFRDPTPGYRMVAVVAPVALFTLILYDLFGGVVRQSSSR
ncbi:unnamed protein product [Leptidea sinapis]|uniref:SCP domain-containing protein n=1 Tax=Leptidea sinapis TaxID=189913 RepID=A0A5E4Q4C9_9NEOP|nr:unnamed protein product [Leptidea sinapis]